MRSMPATDNNPLWYKDAIIYETHVKSFYDSDENGIGDFRGLTEKLEYLKNLGVTAIWLLPFYPSPLKDDGYDIADYFNIHPDYGTLRDFRSFLKKAHDIGLKVITELVLNHTSDQHPWFRRARESKGGSRWRDFYVWSSDPNKFSEARIIFKDFENSNWTWDPVGNAYFWHRFYSHQPDLNYDNPRVKKEIFRVLDFWFDMGIDGMRLDAVPYLYEREGTNCENLPETHQFLKELRAHMDARYPNRMLLGEANQWPEDAVAYFGEGNECHMAFHFPIMPRIFMSLWMEDRFPIVDILEQTPQIPENCQWAMFLRNHDELTLEMVSDEERDYMYRVYAKDARARINLGIRRRLAPLMGNNRRKIELMNVLLFSLPGTPIIYYGDELGMGDNYFLGDRNGVRTPMQWSPDRNAGFSKTNPHKLYLPVIIDPEYHYEMINVETQERNLSSMLWWMRRVISVRKRFKSFGRGDINFIDSGNPKVLAFTRNFEDETILVVINLSRFCQVTELDLSQYEGYVPEEIFSGNRFPRIEPNKPYTLTLGIHDYFWFNLLNKRESISIEAEDEPLSTIEINKIADLSVNILSSNFFKDTIKKYLNKCPYFGGQNKNIRNIDIFDIVSISGNQYFDTGFLFLNISYPQGEKDRCLLPFTLKMDNEALYIRQNHPECIIANVSIGGRNGILCDGTYSPDLIENLINLMSKRKRVQGNIGQMICKKSNLSGNLDIAEDRKTSQLKIEIYYPWSNLITYGFSIAVRLYHKLEEGINVSEDILRYLTEMRFENILPYIGSFRYLSKTEETTIGILQRNIPNQGNGWEYVRNMGELFFERLLSLDKAELPKEAASDCIDGLFLEMISLLGKRTAELHKALSSSRKNPEFSPEPFTKLYQRSVYQSMRNELGHSIRTLSYKIGSLSEDLAAQAREVMEIKKDILDKIRLIYQDKVKAQKIRIHGNYHLGHVLFTGKDFLITGFEGDMTKSLGERKIKRSSLRDVASMLYSLNRAARISLRKASSFTKETESLTSPMKLWRELVGEAFLKSYIDNSRSEPFLPEDDNSIKIWLNAFLLERALLELDLELSHEKGQPDIPIGEIMSIMKI